MNQNCIEFSLQLFLPWLHIPGTDPEIFNREEGADDSLSFFSGYGVRIFFLNVTSLYQFDNKTLN